MKVQQAPAWWFGAAVANKLPSATPPVPSALQQTAWIAQLQPPTAMTADETVRTVPGTLTTQLLPTEVAQQLLAHAKKGETTTFLQQLSKALEPAHQATKIIKKISEATESKDTGLFMLPYATERTAFECVGLGFDTLKLATALETSVREQTAYAVTDAVVACGKVMVNAGKAFGYDMGYLAYAVGVGGYVLKAWKTVRDAGPATTILTPLRPMDYASLPYPTTPQAAPEALVAALQQHLQRHP